MNTQQDELCTRVLSAIAWADGQLSHEEMGKVVDLVDQLDYLDRARMQEILFTPTSFTSLDAIKTLEPKARIRLLHDAYLVASQFGRLADAERQIVRDIASTIVDLQRWEEVESCLRSYADYEEKSRRLWGTTHLG